MNRRDFIVSVLKVAASPMVLGGCALTGAAQGAREQIEKIERRTGGRLGVMAVDMKTGGHLAYRASERFPLCSTFKWLLAAQVLSRVDGGVERIDRHVSYGSQDLLKYAPVTRRYVHKGSLSVSELCAAAIQYSDNTAANLLLEAVGGPSSFTTYLRSLGDAVTRLDRIEPDLNSAMPGDLRDTTKPAAMVGNMRRVLLGNELSNRSRQQLVDWLLGTRTGASKLRAGFPEDWRIGHKTGMGGNGTTNDVAIVWPGRPTPVLLAAYLTESAAQIDERNSALANIGRLVTEWVGS